VTSVRFKPSRRAGTPFFETDFGRSDSHVGAKTLSMDVTMKQIIAFGLVVAFGSALHAQTINVRGKVSNGAGQPVANAVVELMLQGAKDTTDSDGSYSITKTVLSNRSLSGTLIESMRLENGILEFTVDKPAPLKIEVFDANGNIKKKESLPKAQPGVHRLNIASPLHSNEMLIIQASIGPLVQTFRYFPSRKDIPEGNFTIAGSMSSTGMLAKMAAAVDTLKVSAAGFSSKKLSLVSYDTTVSVTLDADATAVYNPCPTNGTPCKILPFGDSITRGAKSSDDGGYRAPLFKLVVAGKQKATFTGSQTHGPSQVSGQTFPRTHEGRAGWTIDPGFNMISSSYGGISSLVPSPALNGTPHIILLHIGTNDLFARETANMAARLELLIDKIAKNAPDALIVLAQITPLASANAALTAYNGKIPAIVQSHAAKGQHIIGVDMSKLPRTGLSDGTHPNDQGYAYMADVWYAAIKGLLPK
jgi:lysophospholipase L1-like esterase